MNKRRMIGWCVMMAGISLTARATAAGGPAAAPTGSDFKTRAENYAFESRQYAAAGKPITRVMARRFADLSRSYGARAALTQGAR